MSKLTVPADAQCVVCGQKGVRSIRYGDIKPSTTPTLHRTSVGGKPVYYWTFESRMPKPNDVASQFLKQPVSGMVILWSPEGLTTWEVENPHTSAPTVPRSNWAQIGKQLVGSSFSVSERLQQKLDEEAARTAALLELEAMRIRTTQFEDEEDGEDPEYDNYEL